MKRILSFFLIFLLSTFLPAGSQGPCVEVGTGENPRGLAVGDPFGDGSDHLVVGLYGAPTFIGQSTPASLMGSVRWGLQVFSPSPQGLRPVHKIPTAQGPRGIRLADLDGDGRQEILVTAHEAGSLQVFEWDGSAFGIRQEIPGLQGPVGLAVGRSYEGKIIVATAEFGADRISFRSVQGGHLGDPSVFPVGPGPVQVEAIRSGEDGSSAFAVACLRGGSIQILTSVQGGPSDPGLWKTQELPLPEGGSPADLKAGDLDGDGDEDLAVIDFAKSRLWIVRNEGGIFVPGSLVPTSGHHPNGLTVADPDGDGLPWIYVANRDSDRVDIFSSEGGSLRLLESLPVAEGPGASFGPVELEILDVRSDGSFGLVASHMRSNTLRVLEGGVPTGNVAALAGPRENEEEGFGPGTTRIYPNPARGGKVTLRFFRPEGEKISIRIFDITGAGVWGREFGSQEMEKGIQTVEWDCVNGEGRRVASGYYIIRLSAGGNTVTKGVVLIR